MSSYEQKYFQEKIECAAKSFNESLTKFNLLVTKDDGDDWNKCPEVNTTYHFAKQFAPYTFFETPFREKRGEKHDNHFDGFVYDKTEKWAIIIEAKGLFYKEKLKSLISDAKRIDNMVNKDEESGIPSLLKRLKTQCKPAIKPKKIFALLLAEVWDKPIKQWWDPEKGEKKPADWGLREGTKNKFPGYEKNFDSVLVGKEFPKLNNYDEKNNLYCCYTFKRLEL